MKLKNALKESISKEIGKLKIQKRSSISKLENQIAVDQNIITLGPNEVGVRREFKGERGTLEVFNQTIGNKLYAGFLKIPSFESAVDFIKKDAEQIDWLKNPKGKTFKIEVVLVQRTGVICVKEI
jgi:hypothetical protein